MRLLVLVLVLSAVAAYVPTLAASQLSSSRIATSTPLAFAHMERSSAGAIMMSGKEGPPQSEMFDPVYIGVACTFWLIVLAKIQGVF